MVSREGGTGDEESKIKGGELFTNFGDELVIERVWKDGLRWWSGMVSVILL
jgi:hypothetical protein